MADIFISYAHDDRARIARLAAALEKDGHSVWWDRHIAGGAEFSEDIERELDAASAVIVAWSAKSVASRWVRDEAGIAANADKLVAISLDGSEPPIGFKQLHAIDFSDDSLEAMQDLERSLALKLGAERSVAPELVHAPKAGARKWVATLAAVAVLFVIGVSGWLWLDRSGGSAGEGETQVLASVAVLPFVATSSGEDDQYFADGLSEEILNRLSALPELSVTSRTASFYFRDREMPLNEIAAELEVGHLVEGSLQMEGDQLRVTARLIEAATGESLWAERYDATVESTLQVQADIAEKVAGTLDVLLDEAKRTRMADAGIDNPEAFALYAKAVALSEEAHRRNIDLDLMKQAVDLYLASFDMEPKLWAAPYEATDYYWHIVIADANGFPMTDVPEEAYREGTQEMVRLLGLAANAAQSEAGRARTMQQLTLMSDDWTRLREFEMRAINSADDCLGYLAIGQPSAFFDRAQAWFEAAKSFRPCKPFDVASPAETVLMALWAGQHEEALSLIADGEAKGIFPDGLVADMTFRTLLAMGRRDEALAMEQISPGRKSVARGDKQYYADRGFPFTPEGQAKAIEQFTYGPILQTNARMGELAMANSIAARIDSHPAGSLALLLLIRDCLCGAPFDLSATPNFAKRIEEAGIAWPPKSPIDWPAKDW